MYTANTNYNGIDAGTWLYYSGGWTIDATAQFNCVVDPSPPSPPPSPALSPPPPSPSPPPPKPNPPPNPPPLPPGVFQRPNPPPSPAPPPPAPQQLTGTVTLLSSNYTATNFGTPEQTSFRTGLAAQAGVPLSTVVVTGVNNLAGSTGVVVTVQINNPSNATAVRTALANYPALTTTLKQSGLTYLGSVNAVNFGVAPPPPTSLFIIPNKSAAAQGAPLAPRLRRVPASPSPASRVTRRGFPLSWRSEPCP